jgi:predicted restriction endonuclease
MSQWRSGQWAQVIEDDEPEESISKTKIHSIQNGLLLSQLVHSYFDKYMIAINPDVRVLYLHIR